MSQSVVVATHVPREAHSVAVAPSKKFKVKVAADAPVLLVALADASAVVLVSIFLGAGD